MRELYHNAMLTGKGFRPKVAQKIILDLGLAVELVRRIGKVSEVERAA